jgi:hypothetical protein
LPFAALVAAQAVELTDFQMVAPDPEVEGVAAAGSDTVRAGADRCERAITAKLSLNRGCKLILEGFARGAGFAGSEH